MARDGSRRRAPLQRIARTVRWLAMLYLAEFPPDADLSLGEDCFELRPGLLLVRSERTRSRLYHAIKRQLEDDAALLVAPLADAPKFKGQAPGALKWLREGAGS